MGIISSAKNFLLRNLAFSDSYTAKLAQPKYRAWTISKAVKEGYIASGWVYRAVRLITDAASSVPWKVMAEDGEFIQGHRVRNLFKYPNPHMSSRQFMRLIISWLELSGNGYIYKNKLGMQTKELWPISPDRLAPVPSKTIDEWLKGYALDAGRAIAYEPEQIIHLKFMNPADPLLGISPLEAARCAVDVDVDQQGWNKSAMQNRGVMDGIFSFEKHFKTLSEADEISERLNERYAGKKNARKIGVIGGNAKYQRIGMNAAEMDYINSRKFNREEILIIFGVPPIYAGAMERSTYNNYSTSELVFWFSTVIPLLDDIADMFTFSLQDELAEGEKISADISQVPAIRMAMEQKVKTAKQLHDMGVPFEQINRVFEFGFEEFNGWDKSLVNVHQLDNKTDINELGSKEEGRAALVQIIAADGNFIKPTESGIRALPLQATEAWRSKTKARQYTLSEKRSASQEIAERERLAAEEIAPKIEKYFETVRDEIISAVETNQGNKAKAAEAVIFSHSKDMEEILREVYIDYGVKFGKDVVVQRAEVGEDIRQALNEYLDEEDLLLTEVSLIDRTTASLITDLIDDATMNGMSIGQLQQSIMDVGVFSPSRALMIGRTSMGTSQSMGQWHAAFLTGATHKKWMTATFEVRDEHQERAGEEVEMNETFSPKFGMAVGPRWPLDNRLVAADRINCRCSMSFSIK